MTTTTDSRPPTSVRVSLTATYIDAHIALTDAPPILCEDGLERVPDLALWTLRWSASGDRRETTVSLHGESSPGIVSYLIEGEDPIPDWIPRPDWAACIGQLFPDGPDHG